MKVALGQRIHDGAWGGGNRFVAALADALPARGDRAVFALDDDDIDIVLITDPRSRNPQLAFAPGAVWRYMAGRGRALIVHRINEFRAEYRLDPVRLNERLNIAAQAHADDMARRDYFDHVSPEGGTVGDRATTAGYTWRRILENLAAGHASPAEAVEGWKLSNDHRHAMLDRNVQEAGVGYTYLPEDGGRVRSVHYWALSLGRRLR